MQKSDNEITIVYSRMVAFRGKWGRSKPVAMMAQLSFERRGDASVVHTIRLPFVSQRRRLRTPFSIASGNMSGRLKVVVDDTFVGSIVFSKDDSCILAVKVDQLQALILTGDSWLIGGVAHKTWQLEPEAAKPAQPTGDVACSDSEPDFAGGLDQIVSDRKRRKKQRSWTSSAPVDSSAEPMPIMAEDPLLTLLEEILGDEFAKQAAREAFGDLGGDGAMEDSSDDNDDIAQFQEESEDRSCILLGSMCCRAVVAAVPRAYQ